MGVKNLVYLVMTAIIFYGQCFIILVSTESEQNVLLVVPSQAYCPSATHTPCFTLVQCLQNTNNCFLSNSVVTFLSSDYYTEDVTGFKIIRNVQNLVLRSESNSNSIPSSKIYCSEGLGLAFINIHGLCISGLGFYNCGCKLPNELRTEATTVQTTAYFEFFEGTKMAMFVVNVYNMLFSYVHINNSVGYGLFILNALGNSSVSNSAFMYNNWRALSYHQYDPKLCNSFYGTRNKSSCVGGNVLLVFQDTLKPRCSIQPLYFFSISNCTFRHGVNLDYEQWDPPPYYLYAAGGLSIFTGQTIYSLAVDVTLSVMDSNLGHNGGNVVVYIQDPSGADTIVTLTNNYITNGNSDLEISSNIAFAGGLYVYHGDCGCGYLSPCSLTEHQLTHRRDLRVINCTFTGNSGHHGGAIRIESVIYDFDDSNRLHLQSSALIRSCIISNNSGYDAVLKVTEAYSGPRDEGRSSYRLKFTLESSLITNNKLLSLKLMDLVSQEKASMSTIRFFNLKDCRFISNNVSANYIPGLLVDSQSMELLGTNHFTGNNGKLGGALFIRNGQIILHKHSNIIITHNRADLGAGIFVDNPRYPFRNPYCFFHFPTGTQIRQLDYPQIEFLNNTAGIAGNSIYGGYLDECVIQELSHRPGIRLFVQIFRIPWNNSLTEVSSSVHHLCFCVNKKPKCGIFKQCTSVYPGEQFKVSAVAAGQMNGTVPAVILSEVVQTHSVTASLDSQQDAQQLGTKCGPLTYRVKSTENVLVKILMQTSFEKTQRPSDAIFRILYVNMTRCPLGFSLDRENLVCDCMYFLQRRDVTCFIDNQIFE